MCMCVGLFEFIFVVRAGYAEDLRSSLLASVG